MKHRRFSALFLMLALCLSLLPAGALAEGGTVVAFSPLGAAAEIVTPYKFSLVELQKLFPAELEVTLDTGRTESLAVSWRCVENYDEALDAFHFVPVLDCPLAAGLALPEITARFEGELARSVMESPPAYTGAALPIVGALYGGAYPRVWGALPASWNNYEKGVLPPIRDQNPYGTCWAHAAVGCVEADLIHDGAADTSVDLSELHLVYFAYHEYADEKGCSAGDTVEAGDYLYYGGNSQQATNRFANLVGPAREADVPYYLNTGYAPGPDKGRDDNCRIQIAASYEMNTADRDAVKYNIMEHGAVDVSYYDADPYYSYTYNSYYCPDQAGTNHAVMLVGWNDSFSNKYFTGGTPEGDGAWLVRNSWGGSGYSHFSYFWISYYDRSLSETAVAYDAVTSQYDHCYAYCGTPYAWTYSMSDGVSAAQSYDLTGGETVRAVGVQTMDANLTLTVTVTCGGRTVSQSCGTTYAGFYLIPLNQPIPVPQNTAATVTVTYSGADTIDIPFESPGSFMQYTAACASGGLVISNGFYADFNTGGDSYIRLYTDDGLEEAFVYGEPDFRLPAKTRTVGNNAFEGLKMRVVYVPDLCTDIGAYAFSNCTELTQIRLPKNCTIDSTAFSGCGALACVFAPAGGTTEAWCLRSNIPFAAE